jgi:hypothetical protein
MIRTPGQKHADSCQSGVRLHWKTAAGRTFCRDTESDFSIRAVALRRQDEDLTLPGDCAAPYRVAMREILFPRLTGEEEILKGSIGRAS